MKISSKSQEELIKVRPSAENGLWLGLLLPIAVIISFIKYPNESSALYHCCFLFTLGITYTTILFIIFYTQHNNVKLNKRYFIFPTVAVSCTFHVFNYGTFLCCYSGILSSIGFYKIYILTLRKFPWSFTLGEALFCAQGFTIFLYSTFINLYNAAHYPLKTDLQISTLVIQVGLLSVALICYLAQKYESLQKVFAFYTMSVIIIIFILLLPLHLLLKQSPVLWIFGLLTKDINTLLMFAYWVLCSGCATYAVSKQIKVAKKASTVIRKSFHILAILVFLPGLLFECIFIYLASGVTLGIFIILELLRNLNIPPLGTSLQDGFMVFSDEKDIGNVALTPIYLLIGCAIPLWIHPIPCDVTNSAMFNILPLVSGLLSVGIGDTMASYVGNLFGKHKWPGTNKTIEGTVGCILSQFLTVYLLFKFGYYNIQQNDITKISVAVITVALVEAKTTQVDNIVLPLLMYSILL